MKDLFKNPRNLTFLGVMFGLSVVLLFATMIPGFGASIAVVMFLPTILTGIIKGPKAGWLMGTAMGIVIMIRAMTMPMSILDPLFINPLVSVVPRMFIGVVAYWVYALIVRDSKSTGRIATAGAVAGAMGMITNTVLVMSALYLFYAEKITELMGIGFKVLLIGIISSSAIIEAVTAAILTSAIIAIYKKTSRGQNA
ncbi:MAG: ECF transporter S component [Eubacteriaceae bacterium]|jgi:uncharacterized membrane protein|nr:ECF transporter S component [Eubacteriaceae bacterium]